MYHFDLTRNGSLPYFSPVRTARRVFGEGIFVDATSAGDSGVLLSAPVAFNFVNVRNATNSTVTDSSTTAAGNAALSRGSALTVVNVTLLFKEFEETTATASSAYTPKIKVRLLSLPPRGVAPTESVNASTNTWRDAPGLPLAGVGDLVQVAAASLREYSPSGWTYVEASASSSSSSASGASSGHCSQSVVGTCGGLRLVVQTIGRDSTTDNTKGVATRVGVSWWRATDCNATALSSAQEALAEVCAAYPAAYDGGWIQGPTFFGNETLFVAAGLDLYVVWRS